MNPLFSMCVTRARHLGVRSGSRRVREAPACLVAVIFDLLGDRQQGSWTRGARNHWSPAINGVTPGPGIIKLHNWCRYKFPGMAINKKAENCHDANFVVVGVTTTCGTGSGDKVGITTTPVFSWLRYFMKYVDKNFMYASPSLQLTNQCSMAGCQVSTQPSTFLLADLSHRWDHWRLMLTWFTVIYNN